jgi:hypothetical protein
MKSKPFEYYRTAGSIGWRPQWVVQSTIYYNNPKLGYFRAVVETRKVARDLITMIKTKYPSQKTNER